ncbi:RNA-binding S4 domain-containing protein [Pleomorphomonas sp. JP5]|uniref:RNA-binding S4 domain-containing protein n=1 Tax=Pleomorphomonas sp. JP5 TaxID=2942998 RepID=UPI0020444496|nr:S4 domain-containing protein [Pleomorphomonas sp. JP5]MCM5556536.1 RNA-binding S4 domain-containing protein [Pleomorphomonas sp. JP5]
MSEEPVSGRQRIDKWLVYARVVKTRTLGQALAASGHVRLNGRKVDDPAQPVKAGDVLTIGLHNKVRVLKVLDFAARRGSFSVASGLYEDLTPPPVAEVAAPTVDAGEGRPTKRDRRRFERLVDPDQSDR